MIFSNFPNPDNVEFRLNIETFTQHIIPWSVNSTAWDVVLRTRKMSNTTRNGIVIHKSRFIDSSLRLTASLTKSVIKPNKQER